MVDTPDSISLARLQATGGNNNLWGGYLNTVITLLSRMMKGYQAYTVNGDATVSWTNYSATNDAAVANVKLNTGTVAAAFTLTLPNYQQDLKVKNNTSFAATLKCSGGTGVTIPAGATAYIYCDGTDFYNNAPWLFPGGITVAGIISGVTAGVAGTDATNVAQVAAAIAAAGLPAGTGAVRNTINDTTPNYLAAKTSGSKAVTASTTSPGGNEVRDFSVEWGALADGGTKSSGFTAASNTKYLFNMSGDGTITLPAAPSAGDIVQYAVSGGYTLMLNPNSLKVNGSASNFTYPPGDFTDRVTYSGSSRGWV